MCPWNKATGFKPTEPFFFPLPSLHSTTCPCSQQCDGKWVTLDVHLQQLLLGYPGHNKQDRSQPCHRMSQKLGYQGHSKFSVTNHKLLLSQKYYIKPQWCHWEHLLVQVSTEAELPAPAHCCVRCSVLFLMHPVCTACKVPWVTVCLLAVFLTETCVCWALFF